MTRSSFPASDQRSAKPFDKVHMDLKSMPTCSYCRYNFFLILFDDCTSHGWTVNLKHKSDADPAIWQFIAMVRTQYGKVIREFQIDAGGEFKSKELTEFLKELGMNILTSVPHMHQQNGRAEHFIRTIMDKSQAIHLESCALQSWWEFAVDCAIHVYNHTPIQCHNWKTPVELLDHTKPDVTHLHVFGCGAYIFLLEEVHHNKINPKSKLMTFIGYPQGVKGYLFMRSLNNVLFTAVQALFDKTLFTKCPNMRRPGYMPAPDQPDGEQGEYNIPLVDDENNGYGGGPPFPLWDLVEGMEISTYHHSHRQDLLHSSCLGRHRGIHHYHPVHLITLVILHLPAYLLWCAPVHLACHQGILMCLACHLPQVLTMTIIGSIVNKNIEIISGIRLIGDKVSRIEELKKHSDTIMLVVVSHWNTM